MFPQFLFVDQKVILNKHIFRSDIYGLIDNVCLTFSIHISPMKLPEKTKKKPNQMYIEDTRVNSHTERSSNVHTKHSSQFNHSSY